MANARRLIDPALAGRAADELPALPGAVTRVVQRADEEYRFLHDNAVAWHGDTLFAAWYNCPQHELVGSSCIRGRRSRNGGATWSPVETIAADTQGRGVFYVPVAFHATPGALYAYIANMVGPDLVTRCEAFVLDEGATPAWRSLGGIADHFLPNCAPVPLANGTWLMAGRRAEDSAHKPAFPAVARSDGARFAAPWTVVPLSTTKLPLHPETTVWADGATITALVRGGPAGGVWLFTSGDFGRTWTGPHANPLPASDSKLYAGRLSTGQRYLVWNWPPARDTLVLGVSRPGEGVLTRVWALRHGLDRALGVGPEWSYPCAIEHAGRLYVIYTSEKRHSVMTAIPVAALAAR